LRAASVMGSPPSREDGLRRGLPPRAGGRG
jgi:hypothetical protein